MQHTEALKRLRDLFRRDDPQHDAVLFSGPSLLDQEPELAHETARHTAASA